MLQHCYLNVNACFHFIEFFNRILFVLLQWNNVYSCMLTVNLYIFFHFIDSFYGTTLYHSIKKFYSGRSFVEYSCTLCSYTTNYHTNIKRHIRLHTGERPFRCPVCHKFFNEKGHFKKHLGVHKKFSLVYS